MSPVDGCSASCPPVGGEGGWIEVAGVASGPRTPTEMRWVVVNVRRRAKVDLGSYAIQISSGLFTFAVPGCLEDTTGTRATYCA